MKIAILGNGLLGSELKRQTNWDCISRSNSSFRIDNTETYQMLSEYDCLINCIANTDTYSEDRDSHWSVNVEFLDKLINFCNSNDIKLIHISTDYIYANSKSSASELDVPSHLPTWYGYSKLVGDALVQLKSNKYLICRLSHKPNPFPYENAWDDVVTNCDYVNKISELIIQLIKSNAEGIFNVGTEKKTIFDLSLKTKVTKPIKSPNQVPKDTSMNVEKIINFLTK